MALDPQLRYPREQPLFILGVVFSSFVWLFLVISIVGIFYGLIAVTFTLMAHALFLANVKGNAVRVSSRQFPDLYARCQRAAKARYLSSRRRRCYLMQASGTLNAFATKLFSRTFSVGGPRCGGVCARRGVGATEHPRTGTSERLRVRSRRP